MVGMFMTAFFLISLGWIPSHFIYFWWEQVNAPVDLVKRFTGYELEDPYTLVRIRDMVVMGYETTVFAVIVVAAYLVGERKRRRQGLRGGDEPRDYLPGK